MDGSDPSDLQMSCQATPSSSAQKRRLKRAKSPRSGQLCFPIILVHALTVSIRSILHIAGIQAPRLGSMTREDEVGQLH